MTATKETKLLLAHQAEMERADAEPYNFGWALGVDFIHSKTSKGKLYSEIDDDNNVTHEWTEVPEN